MLVASALASTVGCAVSGEADELAAALGSVVAVVLLAAVDAVLPAVALVVLDPVVFVSVVVPGVPAAFASASSAGVAVPAVASCGAAAVPGVGAWVWPWVLVVAVASSALDEDVVVVGAGPAVSALVVEAAVAIAAAAIDSGPLEVGEVDGELARPVMTGITTATGFGTTMVASTVVAVALASVVWLGSVELLSDDELSLLFELSDFVPLLLACVAELLLSLLLLPLSALACELAGSLLLLVAGGGLFAWFGWFWPAADEACELLLPGVFRLGDELSLAERCGGGGGGSCAAGSRFEALEGRLLPTSEAKFLASCEASGRAALGGAL